MDIWVDGQKDWQTMGQKARQINRKMTGKKNRWMDAAGNKV